MVGEDDLRFLEGLEPEGEQTRLHGQRSEEEEVVARQRGVPRVPIVGGDQEGEHDAAEEARPGLLHAETEELVAGGGKRAARHHPPGETALGGYVGAQESPRGGGAFRRAREAVANPADRAMHPAREIAYPGCF